MTQLSLSEWKDIAGIAATVIALSALAKGAFEYTVQGAQKRAALFAELRQRFKDDLRFREICALLETDDTALMTTDFRDKRDFLGFFEEICLALNSGLIRKPVAHYMFGY